MKKVILFLSRFMMVLAILVGFAKTMQLVVNSANNSMEMLTSLLVTAFCVVLLITSETREE